MVSKTLKTRRSLDSENNSESTGSTIKPNNSMGDNCTVTRCKRSASINIESPRKKKRGASEPTEVAVEVVTSKGTKRKATTDGEILPKRQRGHSNKTGASEPTEVAVEAVTSKGTKRKSTSERETPSKRLKAHTYNTDTSEPTKVSVEDVQQTDRKKEASPEQLLPTVTPQTTPSSNAPPSSKYNIWSSFFSESTSTANFEAKYEELGRLGEGGYGFVYAGYRKTDGIPVAIKHIPKNKVHSRPVVLNGERCMVPMEVLLMQRAAGGPESAAVSLLDWYDLDDEILLVMERPVPSLDLQNYLDDSLEEDQAKNIMKQLVEAAIQMHSAGVFHRDIKLENVLIETGCRVPRVRVIDFGCGCLVNEGPYSRFAGTAAFAPPELFVQQKYEAGPTTVWQLGALLYEILDVDHEFRTTQFLQTPAKSKRKLKELKVTKDCLDFLMMCLTVKPEERATLEQLQQHPWFNDPQHPTCQTPSTTPCAEPGTD